MPKALSHFCSIVVALFIATHNERLQAHFELILVGASGVSESCTTQRFCLALNGQEIEGHDQKGKEQKPGL